MKNHWMLGGVLVVAVVAGAAVGHVSSNWPAQKYGAADSSLKTTAVSARQQMARMIAETAAHSAAQTAKTLMAGKRLASPTQTASAAAPAEVDLARNSR